MTDRVISLWQAREERCCPVCTKVNRGEWYVLERAGGPVDVCSACRDQASAPSIDPSFQARAKARVEAERRRKNEDIVRTWRLTKKPRPY